MKMLLFPHFLAQRRSQEKTEKYKTQNSTCGVLRKDTLYALSFSVLHTKRSISRSVERSSLASQRSSNYFHHMVAPRCSWRGGLGWSHSQTLVC